MKKRKREGFRQTPEEAEADKAARQTRAFLARHITVGEVSKMFEDFQKEVLAMRGDLEKAEKGIGRLNSRSELYKLRNEALAKTFIEMGEGFADRFVAYAAAQDVDRETLLRHDFKSDAPPPQVTTPSTAVVLRDLATELFDFQRRYESNAAALRELQSLIHRLEDPDLDMDGRIERVHEYNATCSRPEFRITDQYFPIKGWLVNSPDLTPERIEQVATIWGFGPAEREQIFVDRMVAQEFREERKRKGEEEMPSGIPRGGTRGLARIDGMTRDGVIQGGNVNGEATGGR